jgi:hypothetical protein
VTAGAERGDDANGNSQPVSFVSSHTRVREGKECPATLFLIWSENKKARERPRFPPTRRPTLFEHIPEFEAIPEATSDGFYFRRFRTGAQS